MTEEERWKRERVINDNLLQANIPDYSDGKMIHPVFASDNVNDINNNANDVWSQFLFNMKGRLQPLKVQKTVAEQSNIRVEPAMEQTEDQSYNNLQQQQVPYGTSAGSFLISRELWGSTVTIQNDLKIFENFTTSC